MREQLAQVAMTLTWLTEGPYGSSPQTLDLVTLLANVRKVLNET